MALAKQMANKSVVPKSTSGSEGEEEDDDEEEADQSIDVQPSTPASITSADAVFSIVTKMSSQFAEMMQQHSKKQLMSKGKSARSALLFDLPPPLKS
jgi:hypothetical protein